MRNKNGFLGIKYLLVITSVLLAAYLTFSLSSYPSDAISNHFEELDADHPFPIEATNFIENSNDRDSILKSRIDKYDVKSIIDSLLYDQDGTLVFDTCLVFGKISLPVSTYNPSKRIGYIWLDYDKLGTGLMDTKLGKTKSQKQCELEFLNELDEGLEIYFDDKEQFLDDVFGNDTIQRTEAEKQKIIDDWESAFDSLTNEKLTFQDVLKRYNAFNTLNGILEESILDDWKFFRKTLDRKSETVKTFGKEVRSQLSGLSSNSDQKEYLELVLQDLRKQLEVEYIGSNKNKTILDDWKLSAAEVIEEPDRFFGMINRMEEMRMHWPNKELITSLNRQILQISTSKNSKTWWAHSNALLDLFNTNKVPGLCSNKKYHNLLADIMSNDNYTNWSSRYHEIEELGGKENISLEELKILNGVAKKNGIYIAPISVLDDRLIYDMKEKEYLQKLDSLRTKISEVKNKSARQALQNELIESSTYRVINYDKIRNRAKQKSKEILKKDFELFINWAEVENYKNMRV